MRIYSEGLLLAAEHFLTEMFYGDRVISMGVEGEYITSLVGAAMHIVSNSPYGAEFIEWAPSDNPPDDGSSDQKGGDHGKESS